MLTPTTTFPARFHTRHAEATVLAHYNGTYVGLVHSHPENPEGGFPCAWNADGQYVLSDGTTNANDPDNLINPKAVARKFWDNLTDNQRKLAKLIYTGAAGNRLTCVQMLRTALPDLGLKDAVSLTDDVIPCTS
jgi:hypothetical protein